VRRVKALMSSGCKSRPANWVVPAGSNRSGGGGNEAAGASGAKGRFQAIREQAGRNVSER